MTEQEAKAQLIEWGSNRMGMLFNPALLCPGCEGQIGQAYYDLYTTARRVLSGQSVPEGDLVAAATTLENIDDDVI